MSTKRAGQSQQRREPGHEVRALSFQGAAASAAKQDYTVGGRLGQETTVFPIGVWRPKLERLAGHLLDLLSGSERPDIPAGGEESAPTGRTVA